MKSREFKQQNVVIGEDQPRYQNLPALITNDLIITSFKLSEEEINQVVETGTIYIQVLHCGQPLQPIGPTIKNPFIKDEKKY